MSIKMLILAHVPLNLSLNIMLITYNESHAMTVYLQTALKLTTIYT